MTAIVVYCDDGHDTVIVQRFRYQDGEGWRSDSDDPAVLDGARRSYPGQDADDDDRYLELLQSLNVDVEEFDARRPLRERWRLQCALCRTSVPARGEKLDRALDMVRHVADGRRVSLRAVQALLARV